MERVSCQACHTMFLRKLSESWRIYCGRTCPGLVISPCRACLNDFYRLPAQTWRNFCSKDCHLIATTSTNGMTSTVITLCQTCQKPFSRKPEDTWRQYCSRSCLPQMETEVCPTCQTNFQRNPKDKWRKYCSKKCVPSSANLIKCKRCQQEFTKNQDEPWMVCCSQTCVELLLVNRTCERCGKIFQVTQAEGWKKMCGRIDCYDPTAVPKSLSGKPKRSRKPYSKKAIVWLEQIAQQDQIKIQHALNGGEHRISMGERFIRFDGFCHETNTAYEFYGDYWHGHPERYDPLKINTLTDCTFGELYEKTIQRENFIRSQGYRLVTIWESQFDAQT